MTMIEDHYDDGDNYSENVVILVLMIMMMSIVTINGDNDDIMYM